MRCRYAIACNLFASPDAGGPAQVRTKLEVLRTHCESERTDYDSIRKTVLYAGALATGAEEGKRFAEEMLGYAAVGVTEVHVMPMGGDPVAFVHGLGEHVIPRVADV